jgi:predicted CXXCH cytochrome family protein
MYVRLFYIVLALALSFLLSLNIQAQSIKPHEFEKKEPISNQSCIDCHQNVAEKWQTSDHAKAMELANKESVKANFNNVKVSHYGQKAHFFIENNTYHVTISYDGKENTYPIKYTFGHFPLQQYLVETKQGTLQVLPFAWDSRGKSEGGQRWYHNYSHEEIRPEDRLHWRQPLQNWNGMCADCHSDGLTRNYDAKTNTFKTQFDNINVGCLSCHDDMSEHASKNQNKNQNQKVKTTAQLVSNHNPTGQWLRAIGEKTASWKGTHRDNGFMDNCYACHSLRSPLTDGIKASTPFLDQFTPQLPAAPNYYADGQIKEEVYVYGSFLQSKMHSKGVNCLDCHDKHTMKIKVPGNGLCLQCHSDEAYNVKSHHQHDLDSKGAQCVNCHMPTTRYMGVDDRRDHSFKIPRPDLSKKIGSPNACTTCHEGKDNQWAVENLTIWHGKPKSLSRSEKALISLNSGQAINLEDHLALIKDESIAVIHRASAIEQLSFTTQTMTSQILAPYLKHNEALIRLSAAKAASLLVSQERIKSLTPLLSDKYKAVRVAAAQSLIDTAIWSQNNKAFLKAFEALSVSNSINSWRAEGRMNQGVNAYNTGDVLKAEQAFKATTKIEPYFEAGYINLADLYRSQQRAAQVNSVLLTGMKNLPKSGSLKYAYGLHLVRQKDTAKAVNFFQQAMALTPTEAQYAYTYILALDGLGQSQQALSKLKGLIGQYQYKDQLKELGLYLAQKLQSREDYNWFMGVR